MSKRNTCFGVEAMVKRRFFDVSSMLDFCMEFRPAVVWRKLAVFISVPLAFIADQESLLEREALEPETNHKLRSYWTLLNFSLFTPLVHKSDP